MTVGESCRFGHDVDALSEQGQPIDSFARQLRDEPVLVTGATGFTGSVLVRRLSRIGARVRAIARPSSRLSALSDLDIEWIRGHVYDATTVAEAVSGVRYVFHLAAAYREARSTAETYHLVHEISTERLAEAAQRTPDLKRFVHVSTIGVHGHIEHPPANEETPFNPEDVYQRTKADAEVWIRGFADAHRLPLTVVRPCAIYGPGDTRLLKLFRMVARGFFPLLGSGPGLYHLIHVEDLARAITCAAVHPAAMNEAFIVGNPEPIALEQIARVIAGALGREVRIVRLPAWPFFALAFVCETVCRPLGLEPPLYRRRVAFYTKDRAFDTRKLRDRLGVTAELSNEEGLVRTAQWYIEQRWIRSST